MKRIAIAAATFALFSTNSIAEGLALSGKVGTLGYGADLSAGNNKISGRLGLNKFNYKYNGNTNSMNFDFNLKLQTISVLADWYPFEGGFRISGGIFSNKNKIELNAIPGAGATYTINNVAYPASTAVSSMQGRVTFNSAAPYLGFGWGNPVAKDKGWGMVSDVGALFQGNPKYSLTAVCGPALTAPQCATLQADVAAEQAKQQATLNDNFKIWPVVSIGLTYQW